MSAALAQARRAPAATAFILALLGTAAVTFVAPAKPFYYDALAYWNLAETFTQHGHFSLLNFDSALRGYAFPLITHLLRGLGWSGSSAIKAFNVLVVASVGALAAPRLAELAWPERRWGIVRCLGLTAVILVFWSGYLAFPLTDFPALLMALIALTAVTRATSPGWMLVAGLCCALAIDLRPSYVLLGPVLVVLVAWDRWEDRQAAQSTRRSRVVCGLLLVGGFVLVSLPQSLATHRHYDSWSFLPGSVQNLSSFQLTVGMRVQRYETFVGAGKPSPAMYYVDHSGEQLLRQQPNSAIGSSGQYLKITVSHPLAMGAIFGRHVINGLDVRYTTPYIERLDTGSHRPQRIAGFLIAFLALVRLLWAPARRGLGRARWRLPVALVAICATSIPSAMETRFLLPVYTLCYLLVLAPGWPNPLRGPAPLPRRLVAPAVILVGFIAYMAVVWHVASSATGDLHFG